MATGASTADVAILLIDARNGVRTQSKRHARIARLLGITGLRAGDQQDGPGGLRPRRLREDPDDFERVPDRRASVHAIPMSALNGDNVITRSDRTPYFDGLPLLEYLETVQVHRNLPAAPFRFPIQIVVRPDEDVSRLCRTDRVRHHQAGDRVTSWPSGRQRARQANRDLRRRSRHGFAPMSVTLTLDDEIDISRGDVLTHGAGVRRAEVRSRSRLDGRDGRSTRRACIC